MESHRRAALAVSEPLQNAAVALHNLVAVEMQRESHAIIADEALSIDASARKTTVAGQLAELTERWNTVAALVQQGAVALAAAQADIGNWIEENSHQQEPEE